MTFYSCFFWSMFVGNGVKLLMERAIPEGVNNPKFEETYAKFREHYMEHNLDTTRPYDGVPERYMN